MPARPLGKFTMRAAVLAGLVCALVLALAYPTRQYLAQRAEIGGLERSTQAQERRIAELQARKRQVTDPAVVAAEARRRLHFVRPGETGYIVIAPTPAADPARTRHGLAVATGNAPWYSRLWESVVVAGSTGSVSPR
ncbi:MAG: septum formation initiator family protein [Mycobacteriales bacterium]